MAKLMSDPNRKGISWAKLEVFVVNANINNHASRSKDGRSLYGIYYGKRNSSKASYVKDYTQLNHAATEYDSMLSSRS